MPSNESLRSKAESDANRLVAELERELGVPDGFFARLLLSEDDWSFVIKTHALIEAAVTHAVERLVGRPELASTITSLPFNNRRTGKLGFLRALGHADKSFLRFADALSRLRNEIVHDVRNTSIDLGTVVARLPPDRLDELVDAFGTTSDHPRRADPSVRGRQIELLKLAPKNSIWLTARFWLARLYLGSQHEIFKRIEALLDDADEVVRADGRRGRY